MIIESQTSVDQDIYSIPSMPISRKRKRSGAFKRARKRARFASSGSGNIPRGLTVRQGDFNIYRTSRMLTGLLSTAAGTDDYVPVQFLLTDLQGYTQYTSMFDQYRIVAVKMEWTPVQCNNIYYNSTTPAVVNPVVPLLYSAIDLDDANAFTAPALLEHESCKLHGPMTANTGVKYTRWVKPAVALSAYQGAFTGFGSKQGQWIDSGSPGVQHYGIKYWIDMNSAAPACSWQETRTYYIEFKYPI